MKRGGPLRSYTRLERYTRLSPRRARKRRRWDPEPEDHEYLASLRLQACAVRWDPSGHRGRRDPHHPRELGGSMKAPDRKAFTMCRKHHDALHDLCGNGAFAGWTKPKRKEWEAIQGELYRQAYVDSKAAQPPETT